MEDLTKDEAYMLFASVITFVQEMRSKAPSFFGDEVIEEFVKMTKQVGDPVERRDVPVREEATNALIAATWKLVPLCVETPEGPLN